MINLLKTQVTKRLDRKYRENINMNSLTTLVWIYVSNREHIKYFKKDTIWKLLKYKNDTNQTTQPLKKWKYLVILSFRRVVVRYGG